CDAPWPKKKRYPPFVAACNYALDKLRVLDIPHLRPPSDCEMLFHVNDPAQITGYNNSRRSPDINIISLKTALRTHGKNRSWIDCTRNLCQERPDIGFNWSDVLGFVEFKRSNPIACEFPEEFDCAFHDPVPPQILPDDLELLSSASATGSVPSSVSTTNTSNSESNHSQAAPSENGRPSSDTSLRAATGLPDDASGAAHGTKRPLDGADPSLENQGESKKQKAAANLKIQDGIVQCGSYAAEMLTNEVVWVWWYDRQGAIQSSGIDILRDLPLFAALLFALQRLRRADWGYNLELEPQVHQGTPAGSEPQATQEATIRLKIDHVSVNLHESLYNSFGLVGRGTWVFRASSPNWRNSALVAKLSWPNEKREPEGEIVQQAVRVAPSAKDHLPKVFAMWDDYRTMAIRHELGIDQNSKRPFRILRTIIFDHLYPITSVTGPDRIAAIVQCVKCHYLAWEGGVQHRDLSLNNLMVRKQEGKYFGVVNDWDLSHIVGLSKDVGGHTATLPFLAMDLLVPEYWDGKISVEYQHDLEAFVWIIYWLAKCSESPDGKPPKDVLEWQISASVCRKAKSDVLLHFQSTNQSAATIEWRVAAPLLSDFAGSYLEARFKRMRGTRSAADEPTNKSRLENFLQLVSQALSSQNFQLPYSPVVD
ncbi:hypothetical protein FRC10_011145, partial [Ceratobasidium sp. 414]